MDKTKNPLSSVMGIFSKLPMKQRMMIGGILVGTVFMLGLVLFVFNEPSYTTLFSNLAPEDASKVVDYLTAQKIPYKIEQNGTAINVPKDKVYETRLALAGKGVPSSGIVGYEIFDKNSMGMSDFMQKLNYKRALEGELSRTIMEGAGIEGARVHIVIPEKSVFKDEQRDPTASIVLKLKPTATIDENNVAAISNLVASSVEGLKPEKVTIIDTKGRLLSKLSADDGSGMASGRQYEMKTKVESYLSGKAQSMLDNILGYGNSIVKVNVDLDMSQVEKTMETYDPESQVAVSEQTVKSNNSGTSSKDSNTGSNESSTTNYEISKTVEKVLQGPGNIKRITVATVVNGVPRTIQKGDQTEIRYDPRNQDQLNQLEQVVRQAVGVDDTRLDKISMECIPFETKENDEENVKTSPLDQAQKYSNYILIFVAIGASLFVLKGLMKKLKNEKILIGSVGYRDESFNDLIPAGAAAPGIAQAKSQQQIASAKKRPLMEVGDLEDEITDEAAAKKNRTDKIVNYVQKNPTEAAKLINSWLREDEF